MGIFIDNRYGETNEFATVPTWVRNFTDTDEIPFEDYYSIDELYDDIEEYIEQEVKNIYETTSIEELIVMATEGFKSMGVEDESIKEIQNKLKKDLESKTEKQWHELLDDAIYQEQRRTLVKDLQLFRLYGPAHPIANQHLDTDYLSENLVDVDVLCDLYDHDDEDETLIIDWFNGSCDYRRKRIRVRWHAVRLPKLTGGWIGCFCSWDCVSKSLTQSQLTSAPLIELFKTSIEEKGIQDRRSKEKHMGE